MQHGNAVADGQGFLLIVGHEHSVRLCVGTSHTPCMPPLIQRKTILILALAASLVVALVVMASDDQLREQLGTR